MEKQIDERRGHLQAEEAEPGMQPAPPAQPKDDPFLRAANEDDDGYDPYSDRIEHDSMWEADPWN